MFFQISVLRILQSLQENICVGVFLISLQDFKKGISWLDSSCEVYIMNSSSNSSVLLSIDRVTDLRNLNEAVRLCVAVFYEKTRKNVAYLLENKIIESRPTTFTLTIKC